MEPEDEWGSATGGRMVPVVQDGVEEESERREIEKKHSFYFFSILNLGFLKKTRSESKFLNYMGFLEENTGPIHQIQTDSAQRLHQVAPIPVSTHYDSTDIVARKMGFKT